MTFPDKLKYVREKMFLSQDSFAKEIGVSFASVNRWETGKFEPNYRAKKLFYEYCQKNGITFGEN